MAEIEKGHVQMNSGIQVFESLAEAKAQPWREAVPVENSPMPHRVILAGGTIECSTVAEAIRPAQLAINCESARRD